MLGATTMAKMEANWSPMYLVYYPWSPSSSNKCFYWGGL